MRASNIRTGGRGQLSTPGCGTKSCTGGTKSDAYFSISKAAAFLLSYILSVKARTQAELSGAQLTSPISTVAGSKPLDDDRAFLTSDTKLAAKVKELATVRPDFQNKAPNRC